MKYCLFRAVMMTVCLGLCAAEPSPEPTPVKPKPKPQEKQTELLEEMVVTATRDGRERWRVPASVGLISGEAIEKDKPAHPSEILGKVAGVWVNITGGEGHMTAIRQPLSTSPLYLYLENGVPTRSTGFFNHNALYEVNLPQSGGIEVVKGPGSALHGSDAIGGVINVHSNTPPDRREGSANLESAQNGWRRLLVSHGDRLGDSGYRVDVNLTETDGWRDATGYERRGATLQWQRAGNRHNLRAMVTWSDIDQETAGSSAISETDFLNNPEVNYTPISLRQVEALRASLAYDRIYDSGTLSLIPYFRANSMTLLPNWSLTYDPTIYRVENDSFGVLAKYSHDLDAINAKITVGADLDVSPGQRLENRIDPVREGGIFTEYTRAEAVYDYDVTYTGMSGYIHTEWLPMADLHLEAGARYDVMAYDYETRLDPTDSGRWRRPGDTDVDYDELSPKLGASYRFNSAFNLFASYRHAFRAPSEGQLFRQGSSVGTVDLKPVRARNLDLGLRGQLNQAVSYEVTAYQLIKKDDILRFRDPVTDDRISLNAGETSHEGIELALTADVTPQLKLDAAFSYAEHFYESWIIDGNTDYSGNEMNFAPRRIGRLSATWRPARLPDLESVVTLESLGSYWTDQANTNTYAGHDLVHMRMAYVINDQFRFQLGVRNLDDKRYAERAGYNAFRGAEFAPGMPRTVNLQLRYLWR